MMETPEVKLYKGEGGWGKGDQEKGAALKCRDLVPDDFVLTLKGREELVFITVAEVQAGFLTLCRVKNMLYLPTLVGHSLHGVADGNTNCAHGTVTSRV